ncbi:hypothetical protein Cgig2_002580 [Carnegiea gigantea]|uniref:Uncharacterized protein n=1 Tax=Carnegiea gigantea TaxID=171969 RepID=A0A9Q1GP21_9CARY|nr:hypothetical protein Cgig2_002580 [Carnegiea gigantea]
MEKPGRSGRGKKVVKHRKGLGVNRKGKVEEVKRISRNDEREVGGREQGMDVDIKHRYTLDTICALNNQLSDIHKEAVREMRELPFSHFDVALLTGFPATGKCVTFERSDGGSEVEEVLKGAMEECVSRERKRQRTAQKDVRIYRNCVSILLELRRVNNIVEIVALLKKLYTFLVIILVIEVRDNERRVEAVETFITSEEYNAYVEDAQRARDALRKEIEAHAKEKKAHAAMKKKLDELKEAVALKTAVEDILEFARMQRFNSTADAPGITAVCEERTNTDISSRNARVQVDPLSRRLRDVADTMAAGESVSSGQLGSHLVEAELFVGGEVGEVQGQSPYGEERPKSSIAKRVTLPWHRNPSIMQSSLYLHPDRAVGKGKHKYGNVYTSRKWSKKHGGLSAAQLADTDSNVSGAPPGKVGDESQLRSLANANVEPDMRSLADEGFPTGQLRVDDIDAPDESVDGVVHVGMVAEEGVAKDAAATVVSGDITVLDVDNSIDQGGGRKLASDVVDAGVVVRDENSDKGVGKDGTEVPTQPDEGATYEVIMVAGINVVRCDTHGAQADTSPGPSSQTSAVVEGTVAKGRDGSGNPSPAAAVVTMSDEDSAPTSSEVAHRSQSPPNNTPDVQVIGQVCKYWFKTTMW